MDRKTNSSVKLKTHENMDFKITLGVYAENYWEDELSDLITDAAHHILTYLARCQH